MENIVKQAILIDDEAKAIIEVAENKQRNMEEYIQAELKKKKEKIDKNRKKQIFEKEEYWNKQYEIQKEQLLQITQQKLRAIENNFQNQYKQVISIIYKNIIS